MESFTDQLLTINQVAEILNVTRSHVYTIIKQNPDFPVFHISKQAPRVKKSELKEWIDNRERKRVSNE